MFFEKEIQALFDKIVTVEFLNNVETIARYKGETFYTGDCDVSIINKGIISTNKGYIEESYDATIFRDNATTNTNDCLLFLAEIPIPKFDADWYLKHPLKLLIFSINNNGGKDSKYTEKPSFKRFVKDFETGAFKNYNSLIVADEFNQGIYKILRYNDKSDRLMDFCSLNFRLKNVIEEAKEEGYLDDIVLQPRMSVEEYKKFREEERKKVDDFFKNISKEELNQANQKLNNIINKIVDKTFNKEKKI